MSILKFLSSSLGKKLLMGITGICLGLFVLTHLLGNMLLFVGPEAYNTYSHKLISNPLIKLIEGGLLLFFLSHMINGIRLTIENRRARPQKYAMSTNGVKGSSLASKTMIWHGGVLLIFVIHHLITFKYGPYYEATYNGVVMRDLHRLVIEVFKSPGYVAWYVVAMVILGFHLSHGFSSALQSLGFNHPKYAPWIKRLGLSFSVLIAMGFSAQPVYLAFFLNN